MFLWNSLRVIALSYPEVSDAGHTEWKSDKYSHYAASELERLTLRGKSDLMPDSSMRHNGTLEAEDTTAETEHTTE
jgi:hypothetical protein